LKINFEIIFFYFRDIQHVHDMSQNDAKETYNIRLFIQSLHNATYQHRLEYVDINLNWIKKKTNYFYSSQSECKILKRTINQLELGFFDNLVRIQLDGKTIGRVITWSNIKDENENNIECKIIYSTDGKIKTKDLFFLIFFINRKFKSKSTISLWIT